MSKIIFAMSGHTSAGKTTLAKYVKNEFKIEYISEGDIKRQLAGNYDTKDSLSEELRDKGYKKAIEYSIHILKEKNNVILDASFHKQYRRMLLNNTLNDNFSNYNLVWLYCNCSNYEEITKRIILRKVAPKNADNQADDISIYYHIKSNFDLFDITQFKGSCIVVYIDTFLNKVLKIESNYNIFNDGSILLIDVLKNIDIYLNSQRDIHG